MKKFTPFLLSILSFSIIIFLWDFIKLPYDESNLVVGEYFYKKINPINDTLRFLIIIVVPTIIYLICYLKFNQNTYSLSYKSNNFFLVRKFNNFSNPLNIFSFFFLLIAILEFTSLDFSYFVNTIDIFHEGTFLVPPMNYLKTNKFFESTLYDYGFIANNLGFFYYKLFNFYTPNSIILIKLFLIFLIKIFLILLLSKVVNFFSFKKEIKIIFYILLTFVAINLPNYYDFTSYFTQRNFLYIFFVFYLAHTLTKYNNFNLNFILIGFFSFLSIMWWWDIGAYTNALIFFLMIYLFIDQQFKNFFLILVGILISWVLFFLLVPMETIKEFIFQLQIPFSNYWSYLLGIEYVKPFSPNSGRWTKALIIIYLSCIMLINLNFNKKLKLGYEIKIILNLIFISSILVFKSALIRSDTGHLKYSSGLYTIVFLCLVLFYLINYLNNNSKILSYFLFYNNLKKKIFYSLIFVFIFIIQLQNHPNKNSFFNKFNNILEFKKNISVFANINPEKFLSKKHKDIINFYRQISEDDDCVQIFTDDISFSYFLNKKTCTQFYIPAQIINGLTEDKFLYQFKKNSPKVILYESEYKILSNKKNMLKTTKFINNNYSFYKNYRGYIFYKKNI